MSQRDFAYQKADFRRVREMIYARAGISLSDAKEDMVYSRIARRLRVLHIAAFAEYLDALVADPESPEWEAFVNALTTNLTSFFRESHHFDILAELLRKRHAADPSAKILLWSSASSTGEEPYSMAITAIETFGTLTPPVRILATDIDTQVLETAAAGVYPLERLQNLAPARLKRFFLRGSGSREGYVKVAGCLHNLVSFRQINLLDRRWPLRGPLDAIFCRNVMIYFDKPTQRAILANMRPLIRPEGLLFCGHSESFQHATDLFRTRGRSVYAPLAVTDTAGPAACRAMTA